MVCAFGDHGPRLRRSRGFARPACRRSPTRRRAQNPDEVSFISKFGKKQNTLTLKRFQGGMSAPALLGILFFFVMALGTAASIRVTTLIVAIFTLLVVAVRFRFLQERIGLPFVVLTLYVIMDGVSTFYAVSGKFALREFLKVFLAYLLAVTLLACSPRREEVKGKRALTVLAVCAALGALVSIDLISTRWISGIFLGILGWFTDGYQGLGGIESGVRITSMFTNPNTFAGFTGIGVLLCLGLAGSAEPGKERSFFLSLLYVTSLGFMLAFSLGASAFIMLAFLTILALTPAEKRAGLLILMLETLILVAVSAALISRTSFTDWKGVQPVPLICTVLGAAALCVLDRFVGGRLSARLGAHGKALTWLIVALLVLAAVFLLAATNLTGAIDLAPGEQLRRSVYPDPGSYTLELNAEGQLNVTVESQSRRETMMHTETVLYSGAADSASFTVPEDSTVVYFTFTAPEGARITSASCGGEKIPLRYKLLPAFIARRLQGLFANENAIQRLVFFEDGMKLFRRSPVFGLGMGAFENAIKSTQSFYYETKYAHNHYIQTLLETGIVGLALFVALLLSAAFAAWKSRKIRPLAPALGAVTVFMAGHAVTEIVFSTYAYLPMAFGVIAMISYGCAVPILKKSAERTVRTALIGLLSACTVVYCVFLAGNIIAKRKLDRSPTFKTLVQCVNLDHFEWADYALPYVTNVPLDTADYEMLQQADEYAERLSKVNSNTVPIYLAQYYFDSDRPEKGIAMLKKYVNYVSSDETAWNQAFAMLRYYADDSEVFRSGIAEIARMLETWNAENMGEIQLDEETRAFLADYQ